MNNNLLLLSCLFILFSITSCEKVKITGSGNVISEERVVPSFTGLTITGDFNVIIEYGPSQQLTIVADDNVLEYIKTVVQGSSLNVYLEEGSYTQITKDIKIILPELQQIDQSGSVKTAVIGFQNLDALTLSSSGSSIITCSGSCTDLTLSSLDASILNAFDLSSINCSVSASGSSNLNIRVANALNGQLSGSSILNYKDQPSINVGTSGSSQIVDAN
jgi:hypothetical protein